MLGLLPGQVVELHAELEKEAIVIVSEPYSIAKADSITYRVFVGKKNRVLKEKPSVTHLFEVDGRRIFRAGGIIVTERPTDVQEFAQDVVQRSVFVRKFR